MVQVAVAQQTLPELQQEAVAAAVKLQPAQVEERQLGQGFALQAPNLLQLAEALLQPVRKCQGAAQAALPGIEQMYSALKDVLGSLEVCAWQCCLCVSQTSEQNIC